MKMVTKLRAMTRKTLVQMVKAEPLRLEARIVKVRTKVQAWYWTRLLVAKKER